MNVASESSHCPQCGSASPLGAVAGMCPACLARGALDPDGGWLIHKATSASDEAEPVVPGWHITGLIGAGGMGRVYRAESEDDGTVGALKILDTRWSHDPLVSARFEAEAAALRQLDHPHIVRVLATTESDDGRFCLVMDFIDGCDLGRLLRAERLTQERALDIFHKVCAAVAYAHEHGLVHRDIKPANILIGRNGTVKLVDFGLAKDITLDASGHSLIGGLTSTTDQFGTAYYIAPERFAQRSSVGAPSDVFSLGVLLYHLLTGQMPLGKYTPLSQLANLSAKWDAVIASALEADPAKRTASVAALDQSVEQLWQAQLAGTNRRLRMRRLVTLFSIISLAVLMAAAGALWQVRRTSMAPIVFAPPASATKESPWENSLGMKFVPVPGASPLFSIYELRRRDVQPFVTANKDAFSEPWNANLRQRRQDILENPLFTRRLRDGTVIEAKWDEPGWPITPEHPAVLMTVREIQRYCLWLTWKEQAEGRLNPGQRYRMPTDAEWLTACGGENATLRPGNLAGPEARDEFWPPILPTFTDADSFPRTAPVGSFPPELHGLYDISGNVSEWVCDADINSPDAILESKCRVRGPSFANGSPLSAAFAYQRLERPNFRMPNVGVRLVLEHSGADDSR